MIFGVALSPSISNASVPALSIAIGLHSHLSRSLIDYILGTGLSKPAPPAKQNRKITFVKTHMLATGKWYIMRLHADWQQNIFLPTYC